ncbi:hypothetical protein G6O69_29435 [Pseudenhygromyxa sp. WMMC2535]|uniref:hypothetical protein n=1 Tax=Pseudenhygromyxa sp. WMMC2535 TaxID=2712867 RepID=UPI0015527917|nr:hypothetical protein [Pseudenhygromyxa sp. WMMC2535]NVB41986.1 hypothetical protein [Pseudenhygromyxa sp. WMMC2535]
MATVGLMFAWIGIIALNVAAVLGPLVAGRMLSERERELEEEEREAIDAEALALLAGQPLR